MNIKRLLIVAPEFAPSATVSAKRAVKFALAAAEAGREPHILTMAEGCYGSVDPSLMNERTAALPTLRVPCRSIWLHSEVWRSTPPGLPRLMAMFTRALAQYSRPLLPTDKYYPWNIVAVPKAVSYIREQGIDAIWATSPPLASLDVAYRLHLRTRLPFFVDCRDVETVRDNVELDRHIQRLLRRQNEIIERCSGITYCAPFQYGDLTRSCPAAKHKPSLLAWNWFNQGLADAAQPYPFDQTTIIHGGVVYPDAYRFEAYFEALARMKAANQFPPGGLQMLFVGLATREDRLHPLVERYGLQDVVKFRKALPEAEFRTYLRGSAILLLAMGHFHSLQDFPRIIPAKLCEYLGSNRPILVLGPKETVPGDLIKRMRRGITVEDDQPDQIIRGIQTLLDPASREGLLDLSPQAVQEFEGANVVNRMLQFMDKAVGGEK